MSINKNRGKFVQTFVRINGQIPDIDAVLDSNSERAAEIKRITSPTNTSCSIISNNSKLNESFHILVDVGHGVNHSIENIPKSGMISFNQSYLPNALLLTHSHDDHVHDIDTLLNSYDGSKKLNIYCTSETREQIINKFDRYKLDSKAKFIDISAGQAIEIGPFNVTPFSVEHHDPNNANNDGSTNLAGCVMFVVRLQNNKKIVIGWDFLRINGIDQNLFWNPDLVILGTETYNPHPSTGMISVTEAYDFVRTWNAKECFIVHYGGSMDFEDGKNQWFRGPRKAMTSTQLQNTINEQMKLTGNDGKFKMIVASEGQIWSAEEDRKADDMPEDDTPVGRSMEIESLQNYILQLENGKEDQKLHLTIEDRINRYSLEFINPHLDKNNADILYGESVKGMLTKGPELKMQIISGLNSPPDGYQVNVNVIKGKKQIFGDNILIKTVDMKRLKRFIRENFT